MKRLLGVVTITIKPNVDVIYKIFEAKNIDNNIDILNDYADPQHEPAIREEKDLTIRHLDREPNPKFWNFISTERCFYKTPIQVFEEIMEKCNIFLNLTGEL